MKNNTHTVRTVYPPPPPSPPPYVQIRHSRSGRTLTLKRSEQYPGHLTLQTHQDGINITPAELKALVVEAKNIL